MTYILLVQSGPIISQTNIAWYRADSRLAPSQSETVLLCNSVSHWLGANLESALMIFIICSMTQTRDMTFNSQNRAYPSGGHFWYYYPGSLSCCSSNFHTLEVCVPADFISQHLIFRWVVVTWTEWEGIVVVVPVMATRWHALLYSPQYSLRQYHGQQCLDQ